MKYFTQDLIVRGKSEDDTALNALEALWDERCDQYFRYLESIKAAMPRGVRHRHDNYYLHDALIRAMGQRGNAFVIVLQLDTPPRSLITFTYDLLSEPIIQKETLPPEHCGTGSTVAWEYDEIEMVQGAPPTWRQSILLGNGWEV